MIVDSWNIANKYSLMDCRSLLCILLVSGCPLLQRSAVKSVKRVHDTLRAAGDILRQQCVPRCVEIFHCHQWERERTGSIIGDHDSLNALVGLTSCRLAIMENICTTSVLMVNVHEMFIDCQAALSQTFMCNMPLFFNFTACES